jgi:Flp pilus assembly protein TadG
MTARGRRASRDQHGSATVELTLLVPALLLMLGLLVSGGRVWFARTTVNEAAQTSARAASLARTATQAAAAGREAGTESMSTAGLRCTSSAVTVSTAAFSAPVGTPATITSTVRCQVKLSELLPGAPGFVQLTGSGAAALDTYRTR